MNYFAHARPFLIDPAFVAGTALPDWLSVVDRRVRLRPKSIDRWRSSRNAETSATAAALARGALQHLEDDGWFHATRAFAEVTAELGLLFREALGGSDGFRCGFLGHIVTELLIDAALIDRDPASLDQYFGLIEQVEPQVVCEFVEAVTGQPVPGLKWLMIGFLKERFLADYLTDAGLWQRLNQVQRRITLPELPASLIAVLGTARLIVTARLEGLLPAEQFPPDCLRPCANRSSVLTGELLP